MGTTLPDEGGPNEYGLLGTLLGTMAADATEASPKGGGALIELANPAGVVDDWNSP